VDDVLIERARNARSRLLVPRVRRQQLRADSAYRARVVLFSRASDTELDDLHHVLSRADVPCVVIDAYAVEDVQLTLRLDNHKLAVDVCDVPTALVWVRDFEASAMQPTSDLFFDGYRADSWHALIAGIEATGPVVVNGNVMSGSMGRVEQLSMAARLGIRIPETIVTTAPGRCELPGEGEHVIVKPVGSHFVKTEPSVWTGVFATVVRREVFKDHQTSHTPIIVQDYIDFAEEIRAYVVDDETICFTVRQPRPGDIWNDSARVEVSLISPASDVRAMCQAVRQAWGLDFAALDILRDGHGELVFLEANLCASWRWYEGKAQTRMVTHAVSRYLIESYRCAESACER